MASQSNHKSSEYADDDDSVSNSSGEVEKPPVSLFTGEASTAQAVHRLQNVLGSLKISESQEGDELTGEELFSPGSFVIPTLDATSDRDDMFAALPDDCLAAVFRKLSNKDLAQCGLVCKWWFMVDALSRSSLSLRATEELAPQLPKLLDRFQGVHKLVLKCERSSVSINDDALDIIAKNCPRLRKFKLKNCKQVTDVGMDRFSRACPDLRKFSCGGCGFGVAGLSSLLRNCTALEDLTIKRSIRTTLSTPAHAPDLSVTSGPDANTMTLAFGGGARIVVGIPMVFDPATGQPVNGQRPGPAQNGALPGNPAPGNPVAGAAAAALGLAPGRPEAAAPTLAQLDLPETLNLRRLCLKDQNVANLWAPLLEAARKVETLILARNLGSWDPVLGSSLGERKMPELTQLYLEKLHISDRGLRSVACCPKLEALVVVRTQECTDEGISAIAQGCTTLKRLHIEGWAPGHIGDRGLNSLAHNCRQLQELVLVGHSCTVSSMQPLASNCQSLERLTLCSSLSMSDTEMKVIAASCPSLRRLCVKACMRVTDVGIFALISGCPSLQKLKIRRCSGVSQSSLDYLQEQRPELSITQESSATAHDAHRRHRTPAAGAAGGAAAGEGAGEGGAPIVGPVAGRVFDERDDADFEARGYGMRRRGGEHRDESPEVLRRFGSIGAYAGETLAARQRQGGARARFAQAANTIQRALRNWIGAPPGAPGGPGGPETAGAPGALRPPGAPGAPGAHGAVFQFPGPAPVPGAGAVPATITQPLGLRPFTPPRDRENREL